MLSVLDSSLARLSGFGTESGTFGFGTWPLSRGGLFNLNGLFEVNNSLTCRSGYARGGDQVEYYTMIWCRVATVSQLSWDLFLIDALPNKRKLRKWRENTSITAAYERLTYQHARFNPHKASSGFPVAFNCSAERIKPTMQHCHIPRP